MKRKYHKNRFAFYTNLVKILFFPIKAFIYKYKVKNRYHIDKQESVLVLSNHQTDIDPILINYSFNRILTPVATDTLFSNKFAYKFLPYAFGVIPKKKGATDSQAMLQTVRLIKEGGSILLFPEGNRTIAEFQFFISPKLAAFIKKLDVTLVLYNVNGGVGVHPRFAKKRRRGKFFGEIKKVLKPEEYKNLSDEELYNIIKENIKVYDSFNNNSYISKANAEYLERLLFVCPKCKSMCTLSSHKDIIHCDCCGLDVKYNEHLKFESNNKEFNFVYLNDWYQFQKKWIKENEFDMDVIFRDTNIKLFKSNPYEKRKILSKGEIILTQDKLIFNEAEFSLSTIQSASVIAGRKFCFTNDRGSYLVVGEKRFNPFKYVFLFNKLDTKMRNDKTDDYFNLEDDVC